MKVTLNKTNNVNGIIAIEVERPDFQENVEKSLNQFRNKANIPGFRQGKVPKGIIQKMYGKSIVAEEINKLVGNELYKYIKENDLNILGEPLPNEEDQKQIDFDKDETFEFKFDVAIAPEFDLEVSKNDKIEYNNVKIEDDVIDKQIESYKQYQGTYNKIEDQAIETDLIKGTVKEMENGQIKENGIDITNGVLMPSYMKDEATKAKFVGAKVGDTIVFNPRTAYDNNEAEMASLLQTTKEQVADINTDFSFEIQEVTRYAEAQMNQEFFDKILGVNVAKSEDEFKAKVAEAMQAQFAPGSDALFMQSFRKIVLEKLKDVEFPDAFLKRWLLVSNEKDTPETIEKDYPKIIEDLKFHLAKEKIAKAQELKVEMEDVQAVAEEATKAQFAQYGMNNIPEETIKEYSQGMLKNEESVKSMYARALENKITNWLKETVTVENKEVMSKDFNALFETEPQQKEATEN